MILLCFPNSGSKVCRVDKKALTPYATVHGICLD